MKAKQIGKKFVCIGGLNVDRKFYLNKDAILKTSNPCSTSVCLGGVVNNVARNLAFLNYKVKLITTYANDANWKYVLETNHPNIDLSESFEIKKNLVGTGNYNAVLEPNGNLVIGLAEMEILDYLLPEELEKKLLVLQESDVIIIDLNLPKESIKFLSDFANLNQKDMVVIPVSSPKMERLPKNFKKIKWLICNIDETEAYFNIRIDNKDDWLKGLKLWIESGIENIIVTNGDKGIMYMNSIDQKPIYKEVIKAKKIVDVTGAGDSFAAAIIYAYYNEYDMNTVLRAGLLNASQTIQSDKTVRSNLNEEMFKKELGN